MQYNDGEYYVVRFNDGTYYKGSYYISNNRTTNVIEEAHLFQFDWQIPKDIYLAQYLYGKDLICEYVRVKVKTTVEII